MRRMLRTLLFLLGLGASVLMAQNEPMYRFRYLTTEEGLSQNTVDHILRDSQGFLWIATWNGLCRYDGYSMQVIKAGQAPDGLPDNFTQQVCEGPGNRLWIGTAHGLAVYNLVTARFEPIDWLPPVLLQADIEALATDAQGRMWIGTQSDGLFVIGPWLAGASTPAVAHLPLQGKPVSTLEPAKAGGCYLGTFQQWLKVEVSGEELRLVQQVTLPISELHLVRALHEDPVGALWVGTDYGLYRYDKSGEAPQAFLHQLDDPNSLIHNTVTVMARDAEGRFLIGTYGGLCLLGPNGQFTSLQGSPSAHTQLNNPFVNSLLCDTLGNVWVGTEKGGLNRYNIYQKPFHYLTKEEGNPNSLSHKTINSLFIEAGSVWVGTAGGGLNRVHPGEGRIDHAFFDPHQPGSLSSDFVTAIHRDQRGSLWVATWGGGLNRLLSEDMSRFERHFPDQSGVGSNFVSSLVEDPRGFLVAGTSAGLLWFDPSNGTFGRIPLSREAPEVPLAIGCLLLDSHGFYWVGTPQACYRFAAADLRPGVFTPTEVETYTQRSHRDLGMSGDYIISLHEDENGQIWLGTFGSGLLKARTQAERVTGFDNVADGLCNNTIYSIEGGRAGELWLSTDHGLASLDPVSGQIFNYFRSDGLQDNQFYWGASGRGPDGRLYFGGVSGLTFFDPQDIHPYPFSPRVAITDFKVMNRSLEVGEERHGLIAMTRASSLTDSVLLSHRDNVFSIEFAALAYYLPDRLAYQYRMIGVDPDWVEVPADRHFATYTNLSGGSYQFQVRAINEDGVVSENMASLWVIVRPPFWKTSWFTGLMIMLGMLMVMAYIRFRTHYLHQQKAKLEHEVLRRTWQIEEQNAELEKQKGNLLELNEKVNMVNQLRLRFFTNISHEFRTPLTLIIDPVVSLLEAHPADSPTGHTLRIVQRNAQRLLHLINQLMHFRRVESGKLKIQAAEADLQAFVQEVFVSFSHLAERRRVVYRFQVLGKAEGSTWFDPEKLENILFNLLGNAFKYTPEGGSISLTMTFLPGQRVRFLVTDNGPGIPADQHEAIFNQFYQIETRANRLLHGSGIGLALCKELVQSLHGSIWVESGEGEGSTFGVEVPYQREAFAAHELGAVSYHSNLSTQIALAEEELSLPEQVMETGEPAANTDHDGSKPLILIAEDNYDLKAFLTQSLRGQYRVLGADNGKDALELARKYTPQLIVSDIMMPVMDGLELCSHLKAHVQTSHIPVILLTARDAVEHWVEGLETGADDYIPKPFNLKILQTRIDNLIASRQQLKLLFSKGQMPSAREATSNGVDQAFLQKVYDLLEARAKEPDFSHDELADAMCISRSLLYKKLKELSGMSVTEFINSYRLKQASQLLNQGQMTISEVAFICGFNDPKYFSRVFRKYYGMTPSEYAQEGVGEVG